MDQVSVDINQFLVICINEEVSCGISLYDPLFFSLNDFRRFSKGYFFSNEKRFV